MARDERILLFVDTCDMNITLLVVATIVLARSWDKIDMCFSTLFDDIISNIVDIDPSICVSMFYNKTIKNENIPTYYKLTLSR